MKENLSRLLNIKIDDINRNIENLNYLNNELNNNNIDLSYIEDKISIFDSNDVLEFDKIDEENFNKTLSMLEPSISDIFLDKSCDYHGIMYIIKGIRDGISLQLTTNQIDAIYTFTEGLKNKRDDLKEEIANLEESKSRLAETDLTILEDSLDNYTKINNKLLNDQYLTEIEDIISVLEFANIGLDERVNIFEYILTYNRDIYNATAVTEEVEESYEENLDPSFEELKVSNLEDDYNSSELDEIIKNIDLKLKELEESDTTTEIEDDLSINNLEVNEDEIRDSIDFNIDLNNSTYENVESFDEVEDDLNFEEEETSPSIDFNLNIPEFDLEKSEIEENDELDKTIQMPVINDNNDDVLNEVDTFNDLSEPISFDVSDFNLNTPEVNIPAPISFDDVEEVDETVEEVTNNYEEEVPSFEDEIVSEQPVEVEEEKVEDTKETSQELEEIPVQEETEEEYKEEVNEEPAFDSKEILDKYNLGDIANEVFNKNVEIILSRLKEENSLDLFIEYKKLLPKILNNVFLLDVLNIIKNELSLKEAEYLKILRVVAETIPAVLTNDKVSKAFIENSVFYKENNINLVGLFDNNREMLIVNPDNLRENLEIVKKYNLELNNDSVKYLLGNKELVQNIDYYVETMGHEKKAFLGKEMEFDGVEYIKKYPYKLNTINKDTLMKLRYATENGMKIFGSKPGILAGEIANPKVDLLVLPDNYKNSYFKGEYEFADRNDMVKILNNIKDKPIDLTTNKFIDELDKLYKADDLKYKIADVNISRLKTIRVFNALSDSSLNDNFKLIVALTYNSVLKETEYTNIKNCVSNIMEGVK